MREIDLLRIHGSSASPFKRNDLIYLQNHKKEPIQKIDYSNNLCPILIYEKLRINKVYIMCCDPSEGLAQDNNAMTLVDPTTRRPVAEFQSPYISQPNFCRLLCRFLDDYCPRSMIVIENNKGRELINCFMETKYRYQLYYDDGKLDTKVIEKTDPYGRLKMESMQRRAYGLSTTRTNRPEYYGILENIMEESKDLLLTKYLVKDVCGLIRKPNGRVEAGEKEHDDNIMSYLMALFIYYNAPYEKLEEYGIHRGASDSFGIEEDMADYDDQGKLTQEGTLKRLASMAESLPENMRELVQNAIRQKDPVKESRAYYRAVENARRSGGNADFNERDYDDGYNNEEGDSLLPSAAPMDQAAWAEYDRAILQSNERPDITGDDYGFGLGGIDNFDIDDF